MEASALTNASQRGFLARRSPLLKLQGDEKLIAMARSGNSGAFETIVDRYQSRLHGFCRQMLSSTEDAEDVLQEVFVNAYRAMLADEREINLRPWLYRIARNRCLNHLRKPTADAQESMDMVPVVDAASTAERVNNREEFRQLLDDVGKLPETQRSALLFREMDAMSYEEIAAAMETSVPSVKSLLVRARIALAEASQARQLTCGEVRLELAEAAEGLRKVTGPIRRHVRECEECADFRSQVRANDKAMAALFPVGALVALKSFIAAKLGLGGSAGAGSAAGGAGAGATAGTGAAGAAGAGATATAGAAGAGAGAGAVGAALGGGASAGGIGAVGALGTKAVAGVVTAAVLTAGAVEVNNGGDSHQPVAEGSGTTAKVAAPPFRSATPKRRIAPAQTAIGPAQAVAETVPPAEAQASEAQSQPTPAEPKAAAPTPAEDERTAKDDDAGKSASGDEDEDTEASGSEPKVTAGESPEDTPGAPRGGDTVVVTVGGSEDEPLLTGEATDEAADEGGDDGRKTSSSSDKKSSTRPETPSVPVPPVTVPPIEEPAPEEEPPVEEPPVAEEAEEPAPEEGDGTASEEPSEDASVTLEAGGTEVDVEADVG